MFRKLLPIIPFAAVVALPAASQDTRELAAHEHGHGALNIAIDGAQVAVELEVPGFDIVGFEYEAETVADKAAVDAALVTLGDPMALFALPDGAGCEVVEANAELHGGEEHEDHDSDGAHEDAGDHDGADGHEAHGEEAHEDADHQSEGHEEHEEHSEEAAHTEFHAEYLLTCGEIANLTRMELTYFDVFGNAEELEVQALTDTGAMLLEATPDAPVLDFLKAK